MTLGQKLRQTRLEKGMTQSQVAGDHMTRNMLSQLENDSASPSVKTLEYLAAVLEVSVGWLLGEESGPVGSVELAEQARRLYQSSDSRACLELLQAHPEAQGEECRLLLIRSALACAWADFGAGRTQAAETNGKLAAAACQKSVYAGPAEMASANLLLARCLMQRGGDAEPYIQVFQSQCKALGLEEGRHLLLARYHLSRQHTQAAERELWSVSDLSPSSKAEYLLLRGKLEVQKERYRDAALYLRQAEQEPDLPLAQQKEIFSLLELCYREQEDYKQAYAYAARQLALQ